MSQAKNLLANWSITRSILAKGTWCVRDWLTKPAYRKTIIDKC